MRDRGLHVGGRGIDALAQGELQGHVRVALGTLRGDELQSVDLHELALERRGDVVGDGLRAGAGIIRLHLNDGIIDGGQVVYRQTKVTENAEKNHRQGQHRGHDRAANKRFGKIHNLPAGLAGAGELVELAVC